MRIFVIELKVNDVWYPNFDWFRYSSTECWPVLERLRQIHAREEFRVAVYERVEARSDEN